jgi:VanZ family protein
MALTYTLEARSTTSATSQTYTDSADAATHFGSYMLLGLLSGSTITDVRLTDSEDRVLAVFCKSGVAV